MNFKYILIGIFFFIVAYLWFATAIGFHDWIVGPIFGIIYGCFGFVSFFEAFKRED